MRWIIDCYQPFLNQYYYDFFICLPKNRILPLTVYAQHSNKYQYVNVVNTQFFCNSTSSPCRFHSKYGPTECPVCGSGHLCGAACSTRPSPGAGRYQGRHVQPPRRPVHHPWLQEAGPPHRV